MDGRAGEEGLRARMPLCGRACMRVEVYQSAAERKWAERGTHGCDKEREKRELRREEEVTAGPNPGGAHSTSLIDGISSLANWQLDLERNY